MAKVKPTRISTPRIVQPGEGSRSWLWMLLVAALLAWSWQIYTFGQQRAGFDAGERDQVEQALQTRIQALEGERGRLMTDIARAERAGQIDRAAVEAVRAQLRSLQDERAELRHEVAFLKTLVSGGAGKLMLASEGLTKLGERRYRFEVTLSKQDDDNNTVSGVVTVAVVGELAGKSTKIDMQGLTQGKRENIGIKFKNFQRLKAELALPEGFVPASVEVTVRPEGRRFKAFDQAYDWKALDA